MKKESVKKWREFLSEAKWSDRKVPKGKWDQISPDEIDKSRDPENIDLTDEFHSLIDTAYKPIGGNFDFKSPEDLPGDSDVWIAADIDDDPEPDVLRVAKSKPAGTKLTASGHDGSRQAKSASVKNTAELLSQQGYYAELSKAIAHIMITRHDVPAVTDPERVRSVLGKDIEWLGQHPKGMYPDHNGWYTRTIGGKPGVLKIMLGNPN